MKLKLCYFNGSITAFPIIETIANNINKEAPITCKIRINQPLFEFDELIHENYCIILFIVKSKSCEFYINLI